MKLAQAKTLLTALAATGVLATGSTSAAIVNLTDGDFEAGSTGNSALPTPWYDSNNGWDLFLDGTFSGASGNAAALGWATNDPTTQTGFFYQTVGTYDGELSITANGTAYNDTRAGTNSRNVFGDIDVAFYFTSGTSFTPTSGTDIIGAGTLIGSLQEFEEGVNLPGLTSGSTPTSSAFSHTVNFAGSGISNGDEVWVRFSDGDNIFGGNTGEDYDSPFLDDLSVTSVIPEPGSLALMGLGGLCLLKRRRCD